MPNQVICMTDGRLAFRTSDFLPAINDLQEVAEYVCSLPHHLEGPGEYCFPPWRQDGREKTCPGCISETVICKILILCRDIGSGCRCAMLWDDLDLTFDHAVVTLKFKILSGLCLRNC